MNKLKDIIYDKNDLLIALVILLLASFVIYQKIDLIMDYPTSIEAQALANAETPVVEESSDTSEVPETEENTTADQEEASDNEEPAENDVADTDEGNAAAEEDTQTKETVTLTIEYGATGSQIAQNLVDSGVLNSKQEFYDAVNKAGADTRLQAGEFTIPAGSTPDEVISIITN